MSLHQIIHTERKSGLYGGEPGFGVLSSDRDYPRDNEFGEALYSYRAPELDEISPEYTDKLISCMPVSYTYRYKNGKCALTRSACLGKSMYSGGMNHISHSILFDENELAAYPAEYIGSTSFMTDPGDDAVSSTAGVGYVGAPVLAAGAAVSVNKAMKFLSQPSNISVFRGMLWALMHKDDTKRKLVICDEQENTVLWIAALNYVLPLPYAKRVSFSTYVYDPRKTDVDVCGVLPKSTAYARQLSEDDGFYVFDLVSGEIFDPGTYTEDADFFSFIDETMLHSYETLRVFHTYLQLFCDADKPSYAMCAAFLMSRASNCYSASTDSFKAVTEAEFDRIAEYSGRYARYGGKLLLFESMLAVSEAILGLPVSYLSKILGYMSAVYKDASLMLQNGFRTLAVDSVPIKMISRDSTSSSFEEYFEKLREMTSFCGIDITDELISEKSFKALIFVAGYQHIEWRSDFIVTLISEYVHKHDCSHECLSPSDSIGRFLSAVMTQRYACGNDKEASEHALSLFADNVKRYCTVEETLETVTDGMEGGVSVSVNLMTAFAEQAAAHMLEDRVELFDFLAAGEKYELMWATLSQMLSTCPAKLTTTLMTEHNTNYFSASAEYAERYLPEAIEQYYDGYKRKKPENIKEAEELIFGILLSDRLTVSCSDSVVDGIVSRIKLSTPNKETEKVINDVCEYEYNVRGKDLTGKLLCLAFGAAAGTIKNRKDYHSEKPYLTSITKNEQIDLTGFTDSEADDYLDWVLPLFTENAEAEEIPYIYGLFRFRSSQSVKFTEAFCDEWLGYSKRQSDYSDFCTFLRFVFTSLGADELQAVADRVNRLNQKKLEQLKMDAESVFSKDFAMKEKFNYLLSIQPKKKGFFGLFKK